MAKSWRDFAAAAAHDDSANSAKTPIGPIVTIGTATPSRITEGLAALRQIAVPCGFDPERWAQLRGDAERLADAGWVDHAIRLGWSDLDLFGVTEEASFDPREQGLAAWLQGRALRALSDDFAVVVTADGGRHYFNPKRTWPAGTRLLWNIAAGGHGR